MTYSISIKNAPFPSEKDKRELISGGCAYTDAHLSRRLGDGEGPDRECVRSQGGGERETCGGN